MRIWAKRNGRFIDATTSRAASRRRSSWACCPTLDRNAGRKSWIQSGGGVAAPYRRQFGEAVVEQSSPLLERIEQPAVLKISLRWYWIARMRPPSRPGWRRWGRFGNGQNRGFPRPNFVLERARLVARLPPKDPPLVLEFAHSGNGRRGMSDNFTPAPSIDSGN